MIIFLVLGCNSEEVERAKALTSINAYLRLAEDGAWTYRQDLDADDTGGLPPDQELVRARVMEASGAEASAGVSAEGSYVVELRKGARWFDASAYGSLEWRLEEGLFLDSWSLDGASGSGSYPIAAAEPFDNVTVSDGNWSCTAEVLDELWTWYATYERVLQISCSGGEGGPKGVYTFAEKSGLIALEQGDQQLYLVAPW
jgi:hypothetical protein